MNHPTGAYRSNAPPRHPYPRPSAALAGHVLIALLLAVLTLLGGGPTPSGTVLPAPVAAAIPVPAASAPVPAALSSAERQAGDAPAHAVAADPVAPYGPGLSAGPGSGYPAAQISGSPATDVTVPGWLTEAVPQPGPRAGVDRPPAPHPFPPPGHGTLPALPPELAPLRGAGAGPAGGGPSARGRNRAALPGVRGPPEVTAGQPVVHEPCSTDLASRPVRPL
ncbi:hypothetical protein OG206_05140 [Streptomyces sp. NBC_01341]|uniref:hypothetical protein n=1 Tax=Streptomyces sp. NBC_01341 TaxID=2903831 RepID=UPI002E1376D8|nr:hypothetical protein OG206_05140 [Streptomyces sp. NBC_01341]